jgi:hypothetical protein
MGGLKINNPMYQEFRLTTPNRFVFGWIEIDEMDDLFRTPGHLDLLGEPTPADRIPEPPRVHEIRFF